jgi:hypothetical protein
VQHYGVMRDDYTPKPALCTYRDLIAKLSGTQAVGPSSATRERYSAKARFGS